MTDQELEPEEEPHEWWDRDEVGRIKDIVARKLAEYRAQVDSDES
jgi:hypothetical protein